MAPRPSSGSPSPPERACPSQLRTQLPVSCLAAHAGRRVAVFDGKGSDPSFAPGIMAAYLTARPSARVGLFPAQAMDIWRGDAKAVANRLLACWSFTAEAEFYAQVATLALRLALEAPGPPVASSTELARRMIPGVRNLWEERPDELALLKGMDTRLSDVVLRLANLLAALGGAMDGGWSFEDVDLAVVTVPTMAAPHDADAMLRILLVDYGHYTLARKQPGELDTLIFDEFSAIQGGRQAAINLAERARGSGSGTILATQSRQARELAAAEGLEIAETWFYSPECSGTCKATSEPVECSPEHPCINCRDFMYVLSPPTGGSV